MAQSQTPTDEPTDDLRRTAEVTDDYDVLPPEVETRQDPEADVLAAIEAALAEEPNAADEPVLMRAVGDGHAVAVLTANYNELPVTGEGGELKGWLPPYRAREDFDAALREALPTCYDFEHKNGHATTFYAGVSR